MMTTPQMLSFIIAAILVSDNLCLSLRHAVNIVKFQQVINQYCNGHQLQHDLVILSDRSSISSSALHSSPTSDSIDVKGTGKRQSHKNKYAQFSTEKSLIDPLEKAMMKQDAMREKIKQNQAAPDRGTTVPIGKIATQLKKKKMVQQQQLSDNNSTTTTISASSSASSNRTEPVMAKIFKNIESIVPSDPFTFGYVQIGIVIGPHGVKGEVKVKVETDFPDTYFQPGKLVYIKRPNRLTPRPIVVSTGRPQVDDMYLLTFEGIQSRISATTLKQYALFIKSENRPVLQEDEYLIRDLIDLKCYQVVRNDVDNSIDEVKTLSPMSFIGTVSGIVPPDELCDRGSSAALNMHSMIELQVNSQAQWNNNRIVCLIPLVPSIVVSIDLDKRIAFIDPPKGLLDLTYEVASKVIIRGFLPQLAMGLSQEERYHLMKSVSYI